MKSVYLGSLSGSFISFRKNNNQLKLFIHPAEAIVLPFFLALFSILFILNALADKQTSLSAWGVIPLLISGWLFLRARRRIVFYISDRTVGLLQGKKIIKQIPIKNASIIAHKLSLWDPGGEGPLYLSTYVISAGEENLLSVRSLSQLNTILEELRRAGFVAELRTDILQANL